MRHWRLPRWAALVHRLSGVALAVFLPLHFWALGQALHGTKTLDAFLAWARHPLVKATEVALVLALAVHLTGGLRLLAVEFLAWQEDQARRIAWAGAAALAVAILFALSA
ncbi:MAG: succinate dehydrogenase, cytochrome b556 subunit [Alphaproteobacteria bacterium]|nr:succinate dehydrogenase, cytochrome b556 subunit [Alphaproteobacteria bacterium]